MPRSATVPRTIFFGKATEFTQWEVEHPEARDAVRANLPATFRAITIDSHTEAVDQLPNTWRHWSALVEWLDGQELSDSMMALYRRARVLNGVAIPARVGNESVQLDLATEAAPADIHTLFFGTRQRYVEYARMMARRWSIPRSAIVHVETPQQLRGLRILAATIAHNQLDDTDSHWHEYLDYTQQLLVRSGLTREQAHPTVRNFMDTALRNSTVRVLFLGSIERYDQWRRDQQYNREYMQPGAVVHVGNARAMRATMIPNVRVSQFTQVVQQMRPDYEHWFDMLALLTDLFADVESPHLSVTRAIQTCTEMTQRVTYTEQVQQMPVNPIIIPGGAGGGGGNSSGGMSTTLSQRAAQRIDELERRVALLQRALDQIAEDAQRPTAHQMAARHARRVAEGQHILWHATDAPSNYRLISIGEHGDADTLVCYWNTVAQRWEARSDEVWIRR